MNHELQILDGSMGAELIKRGLTPRTGLWSARALLDEPEGVIQVHTDYIEAGASVITTNSYSTIPSYLAKAGMAESYQDLTVVAAKLARQAADAAAQACELPVVYRRLMKATDTIWCPKTSHPGCVSRVGQVLAPHVTVPV